METKQRSTKKRHPSHVSKNSKIPKPIQKQEIKKLDGINCSRLCSTSSTNVSNAPHIYKNTAPSQSSFQHHFERTNSQLDSQASVIFSLEEMICEMQENIETGKANSTEEVQQLKAAKTLLYEQVVELKEEKKNLTELAEKERLNSFGKIQKLEQSIKEMEIALNHLTSENKEEQLKNIAGLQERSLLKSKLEPLVSELETCSQEKLKLILENEEMNKNIETAQNDFQNNKGENIRIEEKMKDLEAMYAQTNATIEELKAKLADAEVGLQELGKENQALQVLNRVLILRTNIYCFRLSLCNFLARSG